MRIATYNLWHGLRPSNVLMFDAMEPSGRKALREKLQIEVLREQAADCYCLQEVNPIYQRGFTLATELNCDFKHQPDLTGIKVLGFGPPFNLASGLITLSPLNLRFVRSLQLSGPRSGFVSRILSLQLKESRYALMSEAVFDQFGRTLMVDLHLHHGLEVDDAFMAEMEAVCEEVGLSPAARGDLRERLLAGNARREMEIELVLKAIERIQSRYELIVVCGDFNASEGSAVYQKMLGAGFVDGWRAAHPDAAGFTFDRAANKANHLLQERFSSTVVFDDLTFSAQAKERLSLAVRAREERQRRIDYVWLKSKGGSIQVSRAELFGLPNEAGLAPSDHFGVVVDLQMEAHCE